MFVSNIEFYTECLKHNVGLNRKVCVDLDGSIKNFVNHSKIFGHVSVNTLESTIDMDEFQQQWYINNEMIEKCRDCQFRYMCFSNSVVEKRNNLCYKLDTCDFNPYSNTWK